MEIMNSSSIIKIKTLISMKNKYLLSILTGIIIALTICVITAVIFRKNHISKNHIMNDVYIDKNFTHDWFTKNIKIWDT